MEIICSCALRNLAYPNATSAMVLPIAVMERTNPEKFVVKVLLKKLKKKQLKFNYPDFPQANRHVMENCTATMADAYQRKSVAINTTMLTVLQRTKSHVAASCSISWRQTFPCRRITNFTKWVFSSLQCIQF